MKIDIRILLVALAGLLHFSSGLAQKKLTSLAPTETYPDDSFLETCATKRAMVVVAHDDDCAAIAGTIAKLNEEGWEIVHVCFDPGNAEREAAHRKSFALIGDRVEFIPLVASEYRNDLGGNRLPYFPIPKDSFPIIFQDRLIRGHLSRIINAFQPSVIFSLDDDMGGYGHPDHTYISGLVRSMAEEGTIAPQRIYQATYTDHMEEQILAIRLENLLKKWGYPSTYKRALETYQVDGMPEPTIQVNIRKQSAVKMLHLRSYGEAERKNLRKFIPYFEDYPAEKYFSVFDREFFRVLEF